MADITRISRLISGINRNIDLETNTLCALSYKVGGSTGTELTQTILDNLIAHLTVGANRHNSTEITQTAAGTNFSSGALNSVLANLDAAIGDLTFVPTNYVDPASDVVASHLSAIDTALASAGSGNFSDSVFRIQDNVDATKELAFEVTGIATATTRSIIMPNVDINLGHIGNLQVLSGVAAASEDLGTFAGSTITDNQDIKAALQEIETAIEGKSAGLHYRGALAAGSDLTGNSTGNAYLDGDSGFELGDFFKVTGNGLITVSDGTVAVNSGDQIIINKVIINDGSIVVADIDKIDNTESADLHKASDLADGEIFIGDGSATPNAVSMSGEATIVNTGVITLANSAVIAKVLTGYSASAGTVAATDSILVAIQKLDGNVANNDTDIANLVTLSGVAANEENLGSFTGNTIADDLTVKAAFQVLESKLEEGTIFEYAIAGETIEANRTFVVRQALNGETSGRVYKADRNAGAVGSETNTIYSVGMAINPTATPIAAGSPVLLVKKGKVEVKSADTPFTAKQDEGLPIYMGAAGAYSLTAPSAVNYAVIVIGTVRAVGGSSEIELSGNNILGIN